MSHRLAAAILAAAFVAPVSASAQTPQAPVLPVIAKSETLPFTVEGGGAIEIAVTEGEQTPSWTVASELALAPYAGKDIRVRARVAGSTDGVFDATYQVRDTYSPGDGLGTPENPDVSVAAASPRYRGWATGYRDYLPGPNVSANFRTPQNALGPVAGRSGLVVIGDRGQLTLTFASPIRDGAGPDFAVFENSFRVGTSGVDFVELGYVEVSSNGTDFVRFDSASTHAAPGTGLAGAPASAFGGLAGRDLAGKGTPFDLTSLRNTPAVRSGRVDLTNITAVRVVDIKGDGNDRDSFGRPIYDPDPTAGSGGFDLVGVGVFNQHDAAITGANVVHRGPAAATIEAIVSPGTRGAQEVRVELSQADDRQDAQVIGAGTVAADAPYERLAVDVNGLFYGVPYAYRVVSESGDGTTVETPWRTFTKTPATVGTPAAPTLVREATGVKATLRAAVDPQTDGELSVRAEYGPVDGDTTLTEPVKVTTASAPSIAVTGLEPLADYRYRYVVARGNGTKVFSPWVEFHTQVASSVVADTSPIRLTAAEARVSILVRPGTTTDQRIAVQWGTSATLATFETTAAQVAPLADPETRLTFTLAGLGTGTHHFRFVVIDDHGATTILTPIRAFTPPGTAPSLTTPAVEAVTATGARVTGQVNPGTFGPQTVRVQVSVSEDGPDPVATEPQMITQSGWVTFTLSGLSAARDHWFRLVATSEDGHVVRSAWVKLTSAAAPEPEPTTMPEPSPTPTPMLEPTVPVTPVPNVVPAPTATPSPTATKPPAVAKAKLAKARARAGSRQRLTVRGLRAGERVVVTYRGKRISSSRAKATRKGTFTLRFAVGRSTGKKTVTVRGRTSGAKLRVAFRVVR